MSSIHNSKDILNFYDITCNLDLLVLKKYPRYPYNLKDSVEFTQNQLTIYYKENYRKDKIKSKVGSNDANGTNMHDISIFGYN